MGGGELLCYFSHIGDVRPLVVEPPPSGGAEAFCLGRGLKRDHGRLALSEGLSEGES